MGIVPAVADEALIAQLVHIGVRSLFMGGYVALAWLLTVVTPLDLVIAVLLVCGAAIVITVPLQRRSAQARELVLVGQEVAAANSRRASI